MVLSINLEWETKQESLVYLGKESLMPAWSRRMSVIISSPLVLMKLL
jgi:hypothetical protein